MICFIDNMLHSLIIILNHKGGIMTSLTLHALDDQLAKRIRCRAKELSISMNELAKRVLAEGLGIKAQTEPHNREIFESFCGSWTEDDIKQFESRTSDLNKINQEDWK